eukprot:UN14361
MVKNMKEFSMENSAFFLTFLIVFTSRHVKCILLKDFPDISEPPRALLRKHQKVSIIYLWGIRQKDKILSLRWETVFLNIFRKKCTRGDFDENILKIKPCDYPGC